MQFIRNQHFHITVNTRTGIPSGIGISTMVYPYRQSVNSISRFNKIRQIISNGGISIRMVSQTHTVYPKIRIVIHAIEDDITFLVFTDFSFENLRIPSYTTGSKCRTSFEILVKWFFYCPVMREIQLPPTFRIVCSQ